MIKVFTFEDSLGGLCEMFNSNKATLLDFTGATIFILMVILFLFQPITINSISFNENMLPSSIYQLNTIFLSIIIEAIPFVLIGVFIAGFIQIFLTEEQISRWIPKNKFSAILMSCSLGALFPACECGIVPIVRRLIGKGVPIYAGIGFLLTGPIINPIVIFSTYMAFGNDLKMAGLRMLLGFVVALIVAFLVSLFFKGNQMHSTISTSSHHHHHHHSPGSFSQKIADMLRHSIDEFFDMGKYLILGAFLASVVQTYVSSSWLLEIGGGTISSILVMMGLGYLLSLCSEADAFIAASFRNLFSGGSLLAFLVYGPMIDLKNTFMMLAVFRVRFVMVLILFITVTVFISTLVVYNWV